MSEEEPTDTLSDESPTPIATGQNIGVITIIVYLVLLIPISVIAGIAVFRIVEDLWIAVVGAAIVFVVLWIWFETDAEPT